MEEKNRKRQIAKISAITTSIFLIVIGITYAYVSTILVGTKKHVITAGTLELVLEEDNEITISDALPMADEVGMIQEEAFKFKLVNNNTSVVSYTLKLSKINGNNELDPSIVRYGVASKYGTGIGALSSSDVVIFSGAIEGNETIDYSLRLWIDSSVTSNDEISGKSLSCKLKVDIVKYPEKAKVTIGGKSFEYEETTNKFPKFSAISSKTNGEGIYKYTEDGKDIYYWRGDVDAVGAANHVIFGGYCWEMVRTTKTGGIKMIYDGTPVESSGVQTCPNTRYASSIPVNAGFNEGYNDNAYVGYMYGLTGVTAEPNSPQCIKLNSAGTAAEVGTETTKETCEQAGGKWATTAYESTHVNVVDSTIKGVIDTWFSTSTLNTEENQKK